MSTADATSSDIATWLAQRSRIQAGHRAHQISNREDLFRDFILAVSKAYGQAMMSNQPDLQDLISMCGAINRMQVLCSPQTVECAQQVARVTVETYFQPNKTFPDILAMMRTGVGLDPLSEFAEAARKELGTLALR